MKKLALAIVMAALVVGLFATVASADATETVYAYEGNPANAVVWRIGEGWIEDCNKTPREQQVVVRANVAQWAKWSVDFSGWEWFVKKPGDYYADCVAGHVQSNGQVTIQFVGFGDLAATEGTNVVNGASGTIETFFAALPGSGEPELDDWVKATELTSCTLPDSMQLHEGYAFKLWNRIIVLDCNSPGTYEDVASLILTLDNQVDWIDEETGNFIPPALPFD